MFRRLIVRLLLLVALACSCSRPATNIFWELKVKAEKGDAHATEIIRGLYSDAPKEKEKSEQWLRKAAEQEDADAQWLLGQIYSDGGLGKPKDAAEGAKWYAQGLKNFQKNAGGGDIHAQLQLGEIYRFGWGAPSVPVDSAEAAKWYRLAAEQGDAAILSHYKSLMSNWSPDDCGAGLVA